MKRPLTFSSHHSRHNDDGSGITNSEKRRPGNSLDCALTPIPDENSGLLLLLFFRQTKTMTQQQQQAAATTKRTMATKGIDPVRKSGSSKHSLWKQSTQWTVLLLICINVVVGSCGSSSISRGGPTQHDGTSSMFHEGCSLLQCPTTPPPLVRSSGSLAPAGGGGNPRAAAQRYNRVLLFAEAVSCVAGKYYFTLIGCLNCPIGYYCPGDDAQYPCRAGTYNPNLSQNSTNACLNCLAGTYNPNVAQGASAACLDCSSGTYSDQDGQSACTRCPVGTYNPSTRQSSSASCLPCSPGTYNPSAGQSAECTVCPSGTFTNASQSSACTFCPVGTYTNTVGSTQCRKCPAGSTTSQSGSTSCESTLSCGPGSYVGGGDECVPCEPGTYSTTRNAVSCTSCPAGTYSTAAAGANTSSVCLKCPAGTYGEVEGAVSAAAACVPCPAGTYGPMSGAPSSAACRACPVGRFSNGTGLASQEECTVCPAGTYSTYPGATSCELCGPGTYSATIASSSFTTCRLCPPGQYASRYGSVQCSLCPAGTASSVVGSTSAVVDCLPCGPGSFSAAGAAVCTVCAAGTFQDMAGQQGCLPCRAGTSTETMPDGGGAASCALCEPGTFAPEPASPRCAVCPSGTLQLERGGTSCSACPADYATLPLAFDTVLESDVCRSYQRTVVLNWGPVAAPALLGVNVTVVSTLPTWLTATVKGGALLTIASDMIPPAAGNRSSATYDVAVTVAHTCRSVPQRSVVSMRLYREDPRFERVDAANSAVLEACPSFVVQYRVHLGTCGAQTTVVATRPDGSALPSSVAYTFANGLLEVAGTLAAADAPLVFVGVAQVGTESFRSAPTTVVLAATTTLRVVPPPELSVRACPYVSLVFRISRASSCGQLRATASLTDGSALPPFLSYAVTTTAAVGDDAATVTVYGTVPAGHPPIVISAAASTGGGVWTNASGSGVTVTRPDQTSTANVSLIVVTGDGGGNSSMSSFVSSVRSLPVLVDAPFGRTVQAVVQIEAGAGGVAALCNSLALTVSTEPPGTSPATAAARPPWLTVASTSVGSSLIVSASPTSALATPGAKAVVFIWAQDGLRNPGFNVTFVVRNSLRVIASSSLSNTSIPQVETPASLVEVSATVVVVSGNGAPTTSTAQLICPDSSPTGASAFCSASVGSTTVLGSFGTTRGVNEVLQGMRWAAMGATVSGSNASISSSSLVLSFRESVNPNALVVRVPLSEVPRYVGVGALRPLMLAATVGKPLLVDLLGASYFAANDAGAGEIQFALSEGPSWLSMLPSGRLVGTPPETALGTSAFVVIATDHYTRAVARGAVNVSRPLNPVAADVPISSWLVASGGQLDVQLPAGMIYDPENGTVALELRRDDGTDTGLTLPGFLTFDSDTKRLTAAPVAADVGTYRLVLIGRTHYDTWQGSARVPLTLEVEESWSDFFARVYEYVGYAGTVAAVVTWCLVQRALLMNMALFRHRFRSQAPESLCCGRHEYVLGTSAGGPPTPTPMVQAVQVRYVERPLAPRRWYEFSAYLAMHRRCADVALKTDFIGGVPWLRATPQTGSPPMVLLRVDVKMLSQLVTVGEAAPADEYYLEVLRTGLWSSGTILEAFTLRVSDVLLLSKSAESPLQVSSPLLLEEDGDDGALVERGDALRSGTAGRGTTCAASVESSSEITLLRNELRELKAAFKARVTALESSLLDSSFAVSKRQTKEKIRDPYRTVIDATPQYLLAMNPHLPDDTQKDQDERDPATQDDDDREDDEVCRRRLDAVLEGLNDGDAAMGEEAGGEEEVAAPAL